MAVVVCGLWSEIAPIGLLATYSIEIKRLWDGTSRH